MRQNTFDELELSYKDPSFEMQYETLIRQGQLIRNGYHRRAFKRKGIVLAGEHVPDIEA